jgi:hypothetical protein
MGRILLNQALKKRFGFGVSAFFAERRRLAEVGCVQGRIRCFNVNRDRIVVN